MQAKSIYMAVECRDVATTSTVEDLLPRKAFNLKQNLCKNRYGKYLIFVAFGTNFCIEINCAARLTSAFTKRNYFRGTFTGKTVKQ